jgi:hypothetical protein
MRFPILEEEEEENHPKATLNETETDIANCKFLIELTGRLGSGPNNSMVFAFNWDNEFLVSSSTLRNTSI